MSERFRALGEKLAGFKYVLLVAAVGLALLLWPSSSSSSQAAARTGAEHTGAREEETRLAGLLADIEGVGQAQVLLSENGAVVVCTGADSASVCLRIAQAVRCYTGLGADDIMIFKLEQNGG